MYVSRTVSEVNIQRQIMAWHWNLG